MSTAKLILDGKEFEFPITVGTEGEVGIDISAQRPKALSDVPLGDVDTVITLCAEECVVLPGTELRRESWSLPDPGATAGDEAATLAAFRQVRDTLRQRIEQLAS